MEDFKKNNFTMIHITAAFMVLAGHQFVLMAQPLITLFGLDLHGLGVRILFMVSGYLVSASYFRSKNPAKFIWKRLSRLYPPLIVCLIITVIVLRLVSDAPEFYWKSAAQYFLHNVEMRPKFDLAGVFTNNPYPVAVNGSLWTLPIEIAWYCLLIPLLEIFRLLQKWSKYLAGAFLIILLFGLSYFDLWKLLNASGMSCVFWDTEWMHLISLGIYFLIGVFVQVMQFGKMCNIQVSGLVVVIYACLPSNIKYFMTPYVISYIVLSIALAENPLFYKYVKKDICYGLYLYAFPIQQLLIHLLIVKQGLQLTPYIMALISAIAVFIIAVIEYYVVEEKIWMKGIKKNSENRTEK